MTARSRTRKKPARAAALDTRKKLLDAGRKVFAAKGLGGASLREDILARAGISSGSFYHQFEDKADLLVEILRTDGGAILDAFTKNAAAREGDTDPVARGRNLLESLFSLTDRHPEFVKIFVREYYSDSPRVRKEIREHTNRTIAHTRKFYEGLGDLLGVSLDADGIATLMTIQTFSLINYYLDYPRARRAEVKKRLIRELLQLASGGVLAVRMR